MRKAAGRAGGLLGAPVRVTESLTARTSTPISAGRPDGGVRARVGGGSGRGWAGCSTTRPRVGSRRCGWCGEIDWPSSPVGWIGRYLSEAGVTVKVVRDRSDRSLVGGLMDDVRAVPASLSGRFSGRCGRNRINDGVSRSTVLLRCTRARWLLDYDQAATTPRQGWEWVNR